MRTTHSTGTAPSRWADGLKKELLLLTTVGMAEERDYFTDADERFIELVGRVALTDDGWLVRFIGWLRDRGEPTGAAAVAAAETARVRLAAGLTISGGYRKLIGDALSRADEPGALLGHWIRRHSRTMPKPIKHGIADAVRRLYDEQALATYDTATTGLRFGDVIGFVHPKPADDDQRELFAYAAVRSRPSATVPASLPLLGARARLYALTPDQRREALDMPDLADRLAEAGMTADLLDTWLPGVADPRAWSAMLPAMTYADLLGRLPELQDSGLSREAARRVGEKLADPEAIAAERVRPLRLYAATRQAPSETRASARAWAVALDEAMPTALTNVPALPGRTLILIDRSVSMFTQVARGSTVTIADLAAVFGTALALRADEAQLVQFGTNHHPVAFAPGEPLPTVLGRFWQLGDGDAADAVRARFHGHDRVVIVTDEPDGSSGRGPHPAATLPAGTPSYIWNVAAHEPAAGGPDDPWYVFSGLADAAFDVIPLIEAVHRGEWPF